MVMKKKKIVKTEDKSTDRSSVAAPSSAAPPASAAPSSAKRTIDDIFGPKKSAAASKKLKKKAAGSSTGAAPASSSSTAAPKAFTKQLPLQQPPSKGSKDDLFGTGQEWRDDGLGGIFNKDGWTNRQLSDKTKVYKAHLIPERDKKGAGMTKQCPFDCDCCFGFAEDGMESFLKGVS